MAKTIFHHVPTPKPKQTWSVNPRPPKAKQAVPGLTLTTRDAAIIQAVYEYRALTALQVETLFFPDHKARGERKIHSNCERRLRLLSLHGFLKRREQLAGFGQGRKPFAYFLAREGALFIAAERGNTVTDLDWRPRQHEIGHLFMDHLLATNDVRIAITLAARRYGFRLVDWRDDTTLRREHAGDNIAIVGTMGATEQAAIVPDGYVVLDSGTEIIRAFVEVDRRTITGASERSGQHDWARKIKVYGEYFRPEGLYEQRYNTRAGRVLTITTGKTRLANLKRITEAQGGKSRYWFTTQEQATTQGVLTQTLWEVAGRDGLYALVK